MGTRSPIALDKKTGTRELLIPICDALFPQDGKDTFSDTSFALNYHGRSLLGFLKNIRIVKTYQGIFYPVNFLMVLSTLTRGILPIAFALKIEASN